MSNDWLPARRTEQLAMAQLWSAALAVKGTAWQIDQGEIMILNAKIKKAEEILKTASETERTESITALLNMRFKNLCDFMRFMYQRKLYEPLLTSADFASLGLKPKDTVRTTVPAPMDVARGSIELSIRYVLTVVHEIIKGPQSDHRANHGVRVNYGVQVEDPEAQSAKTGKKYYFKGVPENANQLAADEFTRRKRHAIAFPSEDAGKTAWFALRIENAKGEKGPWGRCSAR